MLQHTTATGTCLLFSNQFVAFALQDRGSGFIPTHSKDHNAHGWDKGHKLDQTLAYEMCSLRFFTLTNIMLFI